MKDEYFGKSPWELKTKFYEAKERYIRSLNSSDYSWLTITEMSDLADAICESEGIISLDEKTKTVYFQEVGEAMRENLHLLA